MSGTGLRASIYITLSFLWQPNTGLSLTDDEVPTQSELVFFTLLEQGRTRLSPAPEAFLFYSFPLRKKLHCTPRGQSFSKSSSHNPFRPLPCPGSINCSIFFTPTASVCTAILSFALLSYPQRSGSQLGTIGNVWRHFWLLRRWGFPGISSGEVGDAATYPTMQRRPHNLWLSDPKCPECQRWETLPWRDNVV